MRKRAAAIIGNVRNLGPLKLIEDGIFVIVSASTYNRNEMPCEQALTGKADKKETTRPPEATLGCKITTKWEVTPHVFMLSKNSPLVLVLRSLSSRK